MRLTHHRIAFAGMAAVAALATDAVDGNGIDPKRILTGKVVGGVTGALTPTGAGPIAFAVAGGAGENDFGHGVLEMIRPSPHAFAEAWGLSRSRLDSLRAPPTSALRIILGD